MSAKKPQLRRTIPIVAVIAAVLMIPADVYAANRGQVVDVAGQTHDATSLSLMKGCKLKIVCGDVRISVPFRSIGAMKIDPAQIAPVDGRPHFGIEIQMRKTGVVIGSILEDRRCMVGADNGLKWKVSKKAGYSAPFGSLVSVQIFGKGDGNVRTDSDDEDEGDDD